jgi:hypothetical protein
VLAPLVSNQSLPDILSQGSLVLTMVAFSVSGPFLLYLVQMSKAPISVSDDASGRENRTVQSHVWIFLLISYSAAFVMLLSLSIPPALLPLPIPPKLLSDHANRLQWELLNLWYVIPGSLFSSAILDLTNPIQRFIIEKSKSN